MSTDQKKPHPLEALQSGEPLCWVLSDGTAGMVSQSLALAKALDLSYFDVRIFASPIYRLFPQMGTWMGMPISPRRNDRRIGPPWPDIVITAGKRTTGAALAIRRLSRGQTKIIQIQDPRISPDYFDVMVVPRHDPISTKGLGHVVVSKGSLNRLSMTEITAAQKQVSAKIKGPRNFKKTAVMIGGHNKRYRASEADFMKFADQLVAYVGTDKRHLMLVGSRRTPKKALQLLSQRLGSVSHHIWDQSGSNPYPGVLGVADEIIVTSDSVNMTTEACLTGKPVFVAQLQEEQGRIAAFHQMMVASGHTKPLGTAFEAPPVILDEMGVIAHEVLGRVGL